MISFNPSASSSSTPYVGANDVTRDWSNVATDQVASLTTTELAQASISQIQALSTGVVVLLASPQIAALTSAALPKATRAIGKPVAGLNTSWACPLLDTLTWPLMKCEIKGNAAFVIRLPLRMIQMNQG